MILAPKPSLLNELPPGHVVLEASAGTGKTYALEHLVVDLLLGRGLQLEEILVVTFTEKAALELQLRVRGLLERLRRQEVTPEGTDPACAWALDEAARKRLDAALSGFESATIATIHGFCQRVLQESAFECGRLLRQEQASGEVVFERAFQELLRERFAVQPGDRALLRRALAAGKGPEKLLHLLWEAARERAPLEPDADRAAAVLQSLAQLDLDVDAVLSEFKALKVAAQSLKSMERLLPPLAEALVAWRGSRDQEAFWDVFEELRKRLETQLKHFTRPDLEPGPARALGELLPALLRHAPSLDARLVQGFLAPVAERARALKEAQGLFDFDDMILHVREALRGPAGDALQARLRARYKVALIDEFQDTDGVQWEIFRTLFSAQRLVLVGDPKQAIYGFRGGDLPTYRRACAEVLAGAEPLVLDQNFRSTASLIRACNGLLAEDFFTGGNRYEHPVRCGRPALALADAAGAALPPVRVLSVRDLASSGKTKRLLARALAQELKGFIAGQPSLDGRRLDWGDVFVLSATASEGLLVGEALREAGVPHAFFKQQGLFQTPAASWVLDLLRAIEQPLDPGCRARALLTPFFGLGIADLEAVAELPEEHPVLARLQGWAALARARRMPELFHGVLEDSGILRRLLLLQEGGRDTTNLLHILELLQEGSHGGLPERVSLLSQWVRGQNLPEGESGDVQRLEGGVRAVQILTMHKAKGLEAPVVALFGGFSQGRGGSLHRFTENGQRRAYLGAPPEAVKDLVERELAEEDQRLLYVALTRAKARLILPCFQSGSGKVGTSFDKETGDPRGRYGALNRRLRAVLQAGDSDFEWFEVADQPTPPDPKVASSLALGPSAWLPEFLNFPPEVDHEALRAWARPLGITSFTGLQHRLDVAGDPEPSTPGLPLPVGALPAGANTGILLHSVLEKVDLASLQDLDLATWLALPETAALLQAELRLAGAPISWGERVAALVHGALTQPLLLPDAGAVVLRDLEPGKLLRELRFLEPFPGAPDFLTGSLDALFEHGGRTYVLDWKSNLLVGYGPEELQACVREHYALQVRIYTLATLAFLGIRDEADYETRFGGALYVFLRGLPTGVWNHRPSWDDVLAWRRDLAELRPFEGGRS